MTTNVYRGDSSRGHSAVILREVLKAWSQHGRSYPRIGSLSRVKLDRRTVLGLLEETAAVGSLAAVRDPDLIEGAHNETGLILTSAGKAVAFASTSLEGASHPE